MPCSSGALPLQTKAGTHLRTVFNLYTEDDIGYGADQVKTQFSFTRESITTHSIVQSAACTARAARVSFSTGTSTNAATPPPVTSASAAAASWNMNASQCMAQVPPAASFDAIVSRSTDADVSRCPNLCFDCDVHVIDPNRISSWLDVFERAHSYSGQNQSAVDLCDIHYLQKHVVTEDVPLRKPASCLYDPMELGLQFTQRLYVDCILRQRLCWLCTASTLVTPGMCAAHAETAPSAITKQGSHRVAIVSLAFRNKVMPNTVTAVRLVCRSQPSDKPPSEKCEFPYCLRANQLSRAMYSDSGTLQVYLGATYRTRKYNR